MKKTFITCVLILLIGVASTSYAVPGSITLDSILNASGDYSDGMSIFFDAGKYEVSVESGAWNAWSTSAGCDGNGANCIKGWMWSMDIYQPDTSTYYRLGSKIDRYETASLAYTAHATDYLTLDLISDTNLWFFIKDGNPGDGNKLVGDNSGSVTASINSINITTAPEPVSSILFIIGGATLGYRRFYNKKPVNS